MMKVSGFSCALFLVIVTALTSFNFLTPPSASFFPDLVATSCGDKTTLIAVNRKLKENGSSIRSNKKGDIGRVFLDDYNPNDPVPSSSLTRAIPGPIEHGAPLNPYIPRPSPPIPPPGDFK